MNWTCQRRTTVFALEDRRKIWAVLEPSAVARMILARQNMLLWRVAIADNRLKPMAIIRVTLTIQCLLS